MRTKDAEDSKRIWDEVYRKRDETKGPICGECFRPIMDTDPKGAGKWVHADEQLVSAQHAIVPVV